MNGGSGGGRLSTVIGVVAALVAVVGTQLLGWEWGSGQTAPAVIGVVVAVVAVAVALNRVAR